MWKISTKSKMRKKTQHDVCSSYKETYTHSTHVCHTWIHLNCIIWYMFILCRQAIAYTHIWCKLTIHFCHHRTSAHWYDVTYTHKSCGLHKAVSRLSLLIKDFLFIRLDDSLLVWLGSSERQTESESEKMRRYFPCVHTICTSLFESSFTLFSRLFSFAAMHDSPIWYRVLVFMRNNSFTGIILLR